MTASCRVLPSQRIPKTSAIAGLRTFARMVAKNVEDTCLELRTCKMPAQCFFESPPTNVLAVQTNL